MGDERLSGGARPSLWIDQRQPGLRIVPPAQMGRTLGQDYFERRADVRLQKMAREGAPIAPAQHGVHVDGALALGIERHIAPEGSHLHLLFDHIAQVLLRAEVEVRQHGVAEGANRRERCGRELLAIRERLQAGHGLVPALQDHGKGPQIVTLGK